MSGLPTRKIKVFRSAGGWMVDWPDYRGDHNIRSSKLGSFREFRSFDEAIRFASLLEAGPFGWTIKGVDVGPLGLLRKPEKPFATFKEKIFHLLLHRA